MWAPNLPFLNMTGEEPIAGCTGEIRVLPKIEYLPFLIPSDMTIIFLLHSNLDAFYECPLLL